MSLNWLVASHFRNLSDIHVRFSPALNLFFGQNGSGKTSLLEACYFMGMGRSFRDLAADPIIQYEQPELLVRAGVQSGAREHQLGMTRDRQGGRELMVNGERVSRASDMARLLPTLVLGPHTVDLLTGSPVLRRKFLNWGLFHVEPSFQETWDEANRCLRQRNELLRHDDSSAAELETWSAQLAAASEKLDVQRAAYIEQYRPVFARTVEEICGLPEVELVYFRGWRDGQSLFETYIQDIDIDKKRGFTQKGFQRADVRITVAAGQPAASVCSRGELKALTWSMVLSQGVLARRVEKNDKGSDTLYLVDDLASEFDEDHRRRVCQCLLNTGQQILLTGVEPGPLIAACGGGYGSMFHVKQGNIQVQEQ